jgi:molybdopterin synthase catalytic subunit
MRDRSQLRSPRETGESPHALAWVAMRPPGTGEDWVALTADPLPADQVLTWVNRPDCGGTVLFSGTVRDHAEGRPGVTQLTYEAYTEQVVSRLVGLAEQARKRWPTLGRVALLHRTGALSVGECSVLVAVSAPHRGEAFEAARWAIDTLKETVPIWKQEDWEGGSAWATGAHPVEEMPS